MWQSQLFGKLAISLQGICYSTIDLSHSKSGPICVYLSTRPNLHKTSSSISMLSLFLFLVQSETQKNQKRK